MSRYTNELDYLRELAKKYAERANSPVNTSIQARYRDLNSLKQVRPPVLVFEVPWGELENEEPLRLKSETPLCRRTEMQLKRALYQFERFSGDYTVPTEWRVPVPTENSSAGPQASEKTITSQTGTNIMSHEYEDVLPDEESLEKITMPKLSINEEALAQQLEHAINVFGGIMPVAKEGHALYFNMWDEIPRLHGVERSLEDLYERPEFILKMMDKMTKTHETRLDELERLNLLETELFYSHCTPALTHELKKKNMDREKITAKDVWGRGMAQIFSFVSPQMHEEFDLVFMQRLFDRCGLTYYGCCEALDKKIDILKRFKNLRRISITPWADANVAADAMGSSYVLSAKPNPAFVASKTFDPDPVTKEITTVLEACKRNNTPCEFVIKDISTVSNNSNNLTRWVETVNAAIDRYF